VVKPSAVFAELFGKSFAVVFAKNSLPPKYTKKVEKTRLALQKNKEKSS
jgi:hypothetical protein